MNYPEVSVWMGSSGNRLVIKILLWKLWYRRDIYRSSCDKAAQWTVLYVSLSVWPSVTPFFTMFLSRYHRVQGCYLWIMFSFIIYCLWCMRTKIPFIWIDSCFFYIPPTNDASMNKLVMQDHTQNLTMLVSLQKNTWYAELNHLLKFRRYLIIIINGFNYIVIISLRIRWV